MSHEGYQIKFETIKRMLDNTNPSEKQQSTCFDKYLGMVSGI